MDKLAGAQRFALRRDGRGCRNHVDVGRVRNDFLFWNRRRQSICEPIKPRALSDVDLIKDALIGHRSPTERKIDRNERSTLVPRINLSMEHAGIEREMR